MADGVADDRAGTGRPARRDAGAGRTSSAATPAPSSGGGGRVTILSGPGGFAASGATIDGSGGGNFAQADRVWVVTLRVVPAPASLVLLGTGLLGLLGTAWPHGGRARATDGC